MSLRIGSLVLLIVVAAAAAMFSRGDESQARPSGEVLHFPGPGTGYIEVPHDPALNPTDAITIEAWVYLESHSCGGIVGKDYIEAYWLGDCGSGGQLRFYPRAGSSEDGINPIPLNAWTHVAVTYDSTTMNFYINGDLDRSTTDISGPLTPSTDPLRIGNDVSWDISPDGYVEDVRIWNVARTQEQIQRKMSEAVPADAPGLIAMWHLDGDAQDASENGHHGTLTGDIEFASPPPYVFPIVDQLDACHAVTNVAYGYDNTTKSWKGYEPSALDFLQTLILFNVGGGYLVNVSSNCTITVGGNNINLYTGWNLFGWR